MMRTEPFPCSLCGQLVTANTGDEGTCSYQPATQDEIQRWGDTVLSTLWQVKSYIADIESMLSVHNRPDLALDLLSRMEDYIHDEIPYQRVKLSNEYLN